MKKKRILIVTLAVLASLIFTAVATVFAMNAYVMGSTSSKIISPEEAAELEGVDCIIVLGCLVKNDGVPSDRLNDRIQKGVELYKLGASSKIIMSGDHGRPDYDEVNAMKQTAINEGVPSSDIFMDHAGFSTYESMYRAKEIFGAKKIIIVSQEYHLYRAIYIAEALGIEAYGVSADFNVRKLERARCEIREILARCKDFAMAIIKPEPTYLGEKIPISGNGDLTND